MEYTIEDDKYDTNFFQNVMIEWYQNQVPFITRFLSRPREAVPKHLLFIDNIKDTHYVVHELGFGANNQIVVMTYDHMIPPLFTKEVAFRRMLLAQFFRMYQLDEMGQKGSAVFNISNLACENKSDNVVQHYYATVSEKEKQIDSNSCGVIALMRCHYRCMSLCLPSEAIRIDDTQYTMMRIIAYRRYLVGAISNSILHGGMSTIHLSSVMANKLTTHFDRAFKEAKSANTLELGFYFIIKRFIRLTDNEKQLLSTIGEKHSVQLNSVFPKENQGRLYVERIPVTMLPGQVHAILEGLKECFRTKKESGMRTRQKYSETPDLFDLAFGLITHKPTVTKQQGYHVDNARDWPIVKDVEMYADDPVWKATDFKTIRSFEQLGYSMFVSLSDSNTLTVAQANLADKKLINEKKLYLNDGDVLVMTDYLPHSGDSYSGNNGNDSLKLFCAINNRSGGNLRLQRWFDGTPGCPWLRYSPVNGGQ